MTLPAHQGTISMSNVNTELERASAAILTLDDADVRYLFNIPSGMISLDDGHGKTFFRMTGGEGTIETEDGDYKIITFNYISTLTVEGSGSFEYLLVGGGGGGGAWYGGGGGAGGVLAGTGIATAGSLSIYVGSGGISNVDGGSTYWNSSNFSPYYLSVLGGGRGASMGTEGNDAGLGGSGGGGAGLSLNHFLGGLGIAGQGYNGAAGEFASSCGGGGGGAGSVGGSPGYYIGGTGGAGITSVIKGISNPIMIGGGGGGHGPTVGAASHGGGVGGDNSIDGEDGTANTGGGGGGAQKTNGGGTGGSGVAIFRYKYK